MIDKNMSVWIQERFMKNYYQSHLVHKHTNFLINNLSKVVWLRSKVYLLHYTIWYSPRSSYAINKYRPLNQGSESCGHALGISLDAVPRIAVLAAVSQKNPNPDRAVGSRTFAMAKSVMLAWLASIFTDQFTMANSGAPHIPENEILWIFVGCGFQLDPHRLGFNP